MLNVINNPKRENMKDTQKVIGILNDLIRINNDRIVGYEKAIKDSSYDANYDLLFDQMIEQSDIIIQDLKNEVQSIGGEDAADHTTNSGKIYHLWMDIKATFAGKSETSILDLCEFGEDAAQKAYKEALASAGEIPDRTRIMLLSQKDELKESHDLIKAERDLHKATQA